MKCPTYVIYLVKVKFDILTSTSTFKVYLVFEKKWQICQDKVQQEKLEYTGQSAI